MYIRWWMWKCIVNYKILNKCKILKKKKKMPSQFTGYFFSFCPPAGPVQLSLCLFLHLHLLRHFLWYCLLWQHWPSVVSCGKLILSYLFLFDIYWPSSSQLKNIIFREDFLILYIIKHLVTAQNFTYFVIILLIICYSIRLQVK